MFKLGKNSTCWSNLSLQKQPLFLARLEARLAASTRHSLNDNVRVFSGISYPGWCKLHTEHLGANASFMPSITAFAAFHISNQSTEQSTVRSRLCLTPKLEKATPATHTPGGDPLGNPKVKPDGQAVGWICSSLRTFSKTSQPPKDITQA